MLPTDVLPPLTVAMRTYPPAAAAAVAAVVHAETDAVLLTVLAVAAGAAVGGNDACCPDVQGVDLHVDASTRAPATARSTGARASVW